MSAASLLQIDHDLAEEAVVQTSNRVDYVTDGEDLNLFSLVDAQGEEQEGFVQTRARLTGLSGRKQPTNEGEMRIVTESIIVFDDLRVGIVNSNGQKVLHPLLTSEDYEAFRKMSVKDPSTREVRIVRRPLRLKASQWVRPEQRNLISELLDALSGRFNIRWNPPNPPKSRRTTTDIFQAKPNVPFSYDDVESYGIQLDGFQASYSPDYEPSMVNFIHGLNEQQARIDTVASMSDPEAMRTAWETIKSNVHFVGGITEDKKGQEWPRSLNVGILRFDGGEFPLYAAGTVNSPDVSDAFEQAYQKNANGEETPSSSSGLVEPQGPNWDEDDDSES